MLANPFLLYVLSFAAVIAVYQLGWSLAYPPLSATLIAFFVGSSLVGCALALLSRKVVVRMRGTHRAVLPDWVIYPLAAGFCADLAYNDGIPLVRAFGGTLDYAWDVGIPHLHPLFVTFGSVFSTIRFADFVVTGRKRYLLEAILPLIYFLLVVYRGPVVIALVSWTMVYVIQRGIGLREIASIGISAVVLMFCFGWFGDFREQSAETIVKIGQPSEAFERTGAPTTMLWSYIYFTSPMANLQVSIDTKNLDARSTSEFLVDDAPIFTASRILT